ncbi:MAG TPA: ATP-binding protein [Chryseolinea sp.]|nr:ATP-binding protein [Chryseolinea sp.]
MKRFSLLVILRVALILIDITLLAWIFGDVRLFFNQIILVVILIVQVWELIHYINLTNRELTRLFLAIKHADFSVTFNQKGLGSSFKELQGSMLDIVQSYREVKIEKEAQYQFLQQLVNQIQIGIISLQNENIILINPIAEKILGVRNLKNWKLLRQLNPKIAEDLEEDGKKLLEVKSSEGTKMLAVEIRTLLMMDKHYKLITLQDINSEIEQKEIEAWHKLIRILTHEIMNSVTPISSLSETMQTMLVDKNGNQKFLPDLRDDTIKDILFSLNTIQKRSESLLDFVENYRKLTRVPKPVMERVELKPWLASMENLMREELTRQSVSLSVRVEIEPATLEFDPTLIEQVIINLLKNSIHALENRTNKRIQINVYHDELTTILEVTDNGKGISEKELKDIFIPFFSTKKDGSGIGLSLSKQIMSLHNGRIRVSSKSDEGTSFYLIFKRN